MKTIKHYIQPDIEIIIPKDAFMQDLELPVSNTFVGDEAANDAFFDEDLDDEYDPFFDE